jgi:hypothetical protein
MSLPVPCLYLDRVIGSSCHLTYTLYFVQINLIAFCAQLQLQKHLSRLICYVATGETGGACHGIVIQTAKGKAS